MTPKPWSFSALSKYTNCPRAYYEITICKNFVEEDSEELRWGNRVHKSIETYLKTGKFSANVMDKAMESRVAKVIESYKNSFPDHESLAENKAALDKSVAPCSWFGKNVWVRAVLDWMLFSHDSDEAVIVDWKGLPLDTLLATPAGYTTMGNVKVGDKVIGGDGKPCTVVGKSAIRNRDCYGIMFDDKSHVKCDDEHLWKLLDGSVVPVTKLKVGDHMPISSPWDLPEKDLPLDPYILGLWLADGKHTSGEICKPDEFVWNEVQRRGYRIGSDYTEQLHERCRTHTVLGIRKHLKALNVLGDKHIPIEYLRSSYTQRLDLLRGLMDGDGNANMTRKQAVYTTCSKKLSDNVMELLLSLGQRPNQSKVKATGYGVVTTAYPIAFRPIGINPFSLPRKSELIDALWGGGNSNKRRVTHIDKVLSVPTQCISVDSSDNTYLCTNKMLVTHNTGKVAPNSKQLALFALVMFHTYPHINTCHTSFEWIAHGTSTKKTFYREQIPELWNEFMPDLKAYKKSAHSMDFPPRKSGLCRKHCAVMSCEYNGRRS